MLTHFLPGACPGSGLKLLPSIWGCFLILEGRILQTPPRSMAAMKTSPGTQETRVATQKCLPCLSPDGFCTQLLTKASKNLFLSKREEGFF